MQIVGNGICWIQNLFQFMDNLKAFIFQSTVVFLWTGSDCIFLFAHVEAIYFQIYDRVLLMHYC